MVSTLKSNEQIAVKGQKLQALVAEDNLTYRTLACRLLSKWGCVITIAGDGRAAVEACSHQAFDFVLMDLEMPEMDGLTATRLIREQENTSGQRTPIIAMTANNTHSERENCLQAGMDGCLGKEMPAQELYEGIEKLARVNLGRPSSVPAQPAPVVSSEFQHVEIEVAEAFLEEAPQLLEQAKLALAREDGAELARVAHGLKGAAAQVSGSVIVEIASVLETMGRGGSVGRALPILERLGQELDRLLVKLRALTSGK